MAASSSSPLPDEDDAPEEGHAAPGEPSASDEQVRRRLLKPIGALYTLAQTLTDTEQAARHLVESTYARAAGDLARSAAAPAAAHDTDAEARTWLFALLAEVAREAPAALEADETAGSHHFRHRAQERFLRRTLPSAFAALSPAQRFLLTLCDGEGLDPAAAARVTGAPSEDHARERLARARADLRDVLRQMAPRPERPFLEDDALPDARLAAALRAMAERDLAGLPPALRPAARHALSRPQAAPPAENTADAAPTRKAHAPGSPEAADDRHEDDPAQQRRLPRLLVALLLIAVTGGLAYLATSVLTPSDSADLAALSAQNAAGVNLQLRTERTERAGQFVRDSLGRRLRVPRIEGAMLRGVGLAKVASNEYVPVFLFRDASSGRPVAAYAYGYALLDRTEGRLNLSEDARRALQQEGRVVTRNVGPQRVLIWRHRDDIFAAVASDHVDSLRQRIAF